VFWGAPIFTGVYCGRRGAICSFEDFGRKGMNRSTQTFHRLGGRGVTLFIIGGRRGAHQCGDRLSKDIDFSLQSKDNF
jgi:hypothetical protein